MQTDYSIGKCTRKCAVTGEPIAAGQAYYSVILGSGEAVTRQDIAATAWTGPPPKAIGWWRARMPDAVAKKLQPAPVGVLLDTLTELLERPESAALTYLLALLLCRRRVLVDAEQEDSEAAGVNATVWNLIYVPDGRRWAVPVAVASPDLLEDLQTQLNALLFTEI